MFGEMWLFCFKNVSLKCSSFARRSSRESDEEFELFTHAAHIARVQVGVGGANKHFHAGTSCWRTSCAPPGYQSSSCPLTVPPAAPDPVLFTRGSCLGSRLQNHQDETWDKKMQMFVFTREAAPDKIRITVPVPVQMLCLVKCVNQLLTVRNLWNTKSPAAPPGGHTRSLF